MLKADIGNSSGLNACINYSITTDHCSYPGNMARWSSIVVRALALINEVNLYRAQLVLCPGSIPGVKTLISVCNQPASQGQVSLPSLRGQ